MKNQIKKSLMPIGIALIALFLSITPIYSSICSDNAIVRMCGPSYLAPAQFSIDGVDYECASMTMSAGYVDSCEGGFNSGSTGCVDASNEADCRVLITFALCEPYSIEPMGAAFKVLPEVPNARHCPSDI